MDSSGTPDIDSISSTDTGAISRESIVIGQKSTETRKEPLSFNSIHDSVSKRPNHDTITWTSVEGLPFIPQFIKQVQNGHPYFGFTSPLIRITTDKKEFKGKESLFYVIAGLLLLFALFRQAFSKYLIDLSRVFFRTTLNQRQLREQLLQTPLPSLLLNLFFIIIGGLYINFVLQHFKLTTTDNFWLLFFYCTLSLGAIYLVKFLGLKVSGWLFSMPETMESYIFIVFIVNKVIAIFLLPFLVLLAFTTGTIYEIAFTLSWLGISMLMLYRFILSYGAVRNQVKVNLFHFFLYLCAFEIVPLLLIYKVLLFLF